jgi:hypothetical protein
MVDLAVEAHGDVDSHQVVDTAGHPLHATIHHEGYGQGRVGDLERLRHVGLDRIPFGPVLNDQVGDVPIGGGGGDVLHAPEVRGHHVAMILFELEASQFGLLVFSSRARSVELRAYPNRGRRRARALRQRVE